MTAKSNACQNSRSPTERPRGPNGSVESNASLTLQSVVKKIKPGELANVKREIGTPQRDTRRRKGGTKERGVCQPIWFPG